jgi:hypothetical protein
MNRINIDVSKSELDFMREALDTKYKNLIAYLGMCESEPTLPNWNEPPDLSEEEFMDQVAAIEAEAKVFKYKPKKKAPYGVKKDGTPKAKPGRKA